MLKKIIEKNHSIKEMTGEERFNLCNDWSTFDFPKHLIEKYFPISIVQFRDGCFIPTILFHVDKSYISFEFEKGISPIIQIGPQCMHVSTVRSALNDLMGLLHQS